MDNKSLITIENFCSYHKVEYSFLSNIKEAGLIEIHFIEENEIIPEDKIPELERIVRLYKELDINEEAVLVVLQLLEKIELLEKENQLLKKRLNRYDALGF